MKKVVILGAGSAGTMMGNLLNRKLDRKEWNITVIDQDEHHYYQPGFLFLPFGMYTKKDVVKLSRPFLPPSVEYIQEQINRVSADEKTVHLKNGEALSYDILIVATGCDIAPEEVEGMEEGWRKNIFDFYTYEGAALLHEALKNFTAGKIAVHISEMPIKCPVAPLEFVFLADWYFTQKGVRDNIELIYVTPLDSAFTKKRTSEVLSPLLKKKNIQLVTDFMVSHVESDENTLYSLNGKSVEYDLLVTIPPNMGAEFVERSNLGDDLRFIPTDPHTLQSKEHKEIFVIGDATDLPTSKAGSVVHFQAEVLTENILDYINEKPLSSSFDGHANCYIETGYDKAMLLDFNYETDPVEGSFPFPVVGPFSLLKETKTNHYGKLAFKHIYWNWLLKGLPIPLVPSAMTRRGKKF